MQWKPTVKVLKRCPNVTCQKAFKLDRRSPISVENPLPGGLISFQVSCILLYLATINSYTATKLHVHLTAI